MESQHIGFLHPGAMGVFLAATARIAGHSACWASAGRSEHTRARAEKHQLVEVRTVEELCSRCSVIISVCPPHAASEVAQKVLACSFDGVYADVNAISPQRVKEIGANMLDGGVDFVDGGIIGLPGWETERTWLYLSGPRAKTVADCFSGGQLEVQILGDEIGRASALKMCYAANTKGTTALLCAVLAVAEQMGVREDLQRQWTQSGSDFARKTIGRVTGVTAKAWRFSGEMDEIAATFEKAGLPAGFHVAASDIYQRLARFKGSTPLPPIAEVLAALLEPGTASRSS
ncbi:MAG: DUF1932 domain-containing protein [Desulfofustis sp.]|nr:DUF1932 domain-containing protein [Desulfofustis sp.]